MSTTSIPLQGIRLILPWLVTLRGAALETGWVTMRLAGLPWELAVRGAREVAEWFGAGARILPPVDCDGTQGMPVLFVHGLADRASIFARLQNGLRDCSAGPFVTVTYNAFNPDIPTAAKALGEQVERARELSGGRPVCVVGHSLGGLIVRYYVQRLGGDAHVPLAITLATPHTGTAIALWALPHPLLRQLRPGSPLLTDLAGPSPSCRTRFISFYSDLDEAVIPTSRGRLDHPDLRARNILVHGVGHLMLPLDRTVIDEIRRVLDESAAIPVAV
ncbi:alpha/beta fold hydrolase [Streptomyces cavernae]|uniref:alpha/beta fold hydrolase n=1 Tax=Streptomyces cavernae TaxID=2259034 RepID=UPI000FEB880A|nr:alpha/beta fold hydrolase [Streptomyces cavernae]